MPDPEEIFDAEELALWYKFKEKLLVGKTYCTWEDAGINDLLIMVLLQWHNTMKERYPSIALVRLLEETSTNENIPLQSWS